jgi:integration host factor subunit beta
VWGCRRWLLTRSFDDKSELLSKLVEANPHLTQREAKIIVGTIFDEIADTLSHGGRVELRGFGVFSTKRLGARRGRNPLTGDSVNVPEKHFVTFKPGKPMRHRLNG